MYYKCELLTGGLSYSVTNDIKNWDEITATFKRGDYDGIVRSFSDKFEFVKGARTLLKNEYRNNYLNAGATIVISTRNNSWTWTERFRCALDFSTLSDNGYVLSMNAIDDSVASLIKAKKGTQYEYSVDVLKESAPLYYDGLEMKNNVVMDIPPNSQVGETTDIPASKAGTYTIPLYAVNPEISKRNSVAVYDQASQYYDEDELLLENPSFLENISIYSVNVHVSFDFFGVFAASSGSAMFYFVAAKKGETMIHYFAKEITASTDISYDNTVEVPPGYALQMYVRLPAGSVFQIKNVAVKPTVKWMSRIDPVELDVIKPSVLLNRLLKSMNGGKDGLEGVIVPSGEKRLDNAVLLAGESARKLPNARIYSSFTKFCQWMSAVYGYVYDINGKTVTFRPRKDYFTDLLVKRVEDFNGYQMNVNSSLIYSQVNVGYEKQDYDSVNGKDEFRFTNIYNTGTTMTDNRLELVSPYRADAYGIEFLTQKIGEDTTDNETDNNVFFVCARSNGENYILDRADAVEGVISPSTMFNAMYSPTSMISANEAYLAGFIASLQYASSEGNTSVVINGEAENRDMELSGGLFNVNELEIETSDIDLPESLNGYVEFEHHGEVRRGYIQSVDYHYTKTASAKLKLVEKING